MSAVFLAPEYSYTIELITDEDRRKVLSNTKRSIKGYCLIFSCIAALLTIPLFFLELSKEDLIEDLLISLCTLLLVLLITTLIMFLRAKIGLRNKYKIVEKGIITKQDNGGDSDTINYSYIGNNAYSSLPGNIIIGDRISIEHTLNKKKKKNLFIQVYKLQNTDKL